MRPREAIQQEGATEAPLDPSMRAIIARYRLVYLIGAVLLSVVLAASVVGTLILFVRPNLVENQGEATAAASIVTVVLALFLAPMLVGALRAVYRYGAARTARTTTGALRVQTANFLQSLTHFDPTLKRTMFDYLIIDGHRLLLPKYAVGAVSEFPRLARNAPGYVAGLSMRSGTAVYAAGTDLLFELRHPDGRVVYRRPGYTGGQ